MRLLVLSLLALTSVSCAPVLEESRVTRRFARNHACDAAAVRATRGGYLVSGCGVSAFYVCDREPSTLFGALFIGSRGCYEDHAHTRAGPSAATTARAPEARVRTLTHDAGFTVLVADLPVRDARLRLVHAPTRDPGRVQVDFHVPIGEARVCSAHLWVDGDEVPLDLFPVSEDEPAGTRHARFPTPWLERIAAARAVHGEACGVTFELSAGVRAIVTELEARRLRMGAVAPASE